MYLADNLEALSKLDREQIRKLNLDTCNCQEELEQYLDQCITFENCQYMPAFNHAVWCAKITRNVLRILEQKQSDSDPNRNA